MARIILLVLAVLSLVATGWLTSRLLELDQSLEESAQRGQQIEEKLQAFAFDGDGNVAPEHQQDYRLLLLNAEHTVAGLTNLRKRRSEALTFISVGAGATLVFGLLWLRSRRQTAAA